MIPSEKLNSRTPIEAVTGETPDILEYVDFYFYDLMWYHTGDHICVSKDHRALGKWMGVARRVGSDMSYWIMPISGQPISKTTVYHVTRDDMLDPDISVQIKVLDQALIERLDNTNFIIYDFGGFGIKDEGSDMPQWDTWDPPYGDEKTTPTEMEYVKMME